MVRALALARSIVAKKPNRFTVSFPVKETVKHSKNTYKPIITPVSLYFLSSGDQCVKQGLIPNVSHAVSPETYPETRDETVKRDTVSPFHSLGRETVKHLRPPDWSDAYSAL